MYLGTRDGLGTFPGPIWRESITEIAQRPISYSRADGHNGEKSRRILTRNLRRHGNAHREAFDRSRVSARPVATTEYDQVYILHQIVGILQVTFDESSLSRKQKVVESRKYSSLTSALIL